jgi:hypothetical protein
MRPSAEIQKPVIANGVMCSASAARGSYIA